MQPTSIPVQFNRWPATSLPLSYCFTSTFGYVRESEFRTLTADAFSAWGIASEYEGPCSDSQVTENGENQIGWGSLNVGSDQLYEAGVTIRYADCNFRCATESEWFIEEADIVIDADAPPYYASSRCLLSVLVHEVGHFLGLEHLPSPSVMETGGSSCGVLVTALDRRAAEARYGVLGEGTNQLLDEELALTEFVTRQFELFYDENWQALYPLYSPEFRAICSYAEFSAPGESSNVEFDPALLSFSNLSIQIEGDTAEVTYDYLYDDEIVLEVTASDPDIYRKIDGQWFDDVDSTEWDP